MEFNLIVDPKFRDKIPPLTDDEFRQLEENIVEAGEIYEPIVVWNGVIVDGHNRYKIAQMHPEVKWRIRSIEFTDEWAAYDWMYRNQLGRRNLTDEQKTYMIGKMYEARKQSQGGNREMQHDENGRFTASSQNGALRNGKTSIQIAKEIGVGQKTVERAEKFAKGVDAIREVNPEAADKVLRGEAKVTKGEVANIAGADPELQQEAAQAIENGKKLPPMTPTQPKKSPSPTMGKKSTESNFGSDGISEDIDDSVYNINDYKEEYRENSYDLIDSLRMLKQTRFPLFDTKENRIEMCEVIEEIKCELDELKEEYRNGK